MSSILTYVLIVVDMIAVAIILWFLLDEKKSKQFPLVFSLGLAIGGSGLAGENMLSIYRLNGIDFFPQTQVIWWFGKDVGLIMMTYFAVFGKWVSISEKKFAEGKCAQ